MVCRPAPSQASASHLSKMTHSGLGLGIGRLLGVLQCFRRQDVQERQAGVVVKPEQGESKILMSCDQSGISSLCDSLWQI